MPPNERTDRFGSVEMADALHRLLSGRNRRTRLDSARDVTRQEWEYLNRTRWAHPEETYRRMIRNMLRPDLMNPEFPLAAPPPRRPWRPDWDFSRMENVTEPRLGPLAPLPRPKIRTPAKRREVDLRKARMRNLAPTRVRPSQIMRSTLTGVPNASVRATQKYIGSPSGKRSNAKRQ